MLSTWQVIVGVVAGLVLAGAAVLGYWARQVQAPARGNPDEFLRQGGKRAGQRVVVCLGASIVHGRVSVDFVELLRRRFAGSNLTFVNAGVNGDLAYNALARLDSVLACRPDDVVILIGTNDVQGTLSESIKRLSMRGKRLPVEPSLDWYCSNILEIVMRLKQESVRVAIASLPVLGEDLGGQANQRVREFNAALRQIAEQQEATYLPVHECQEEYLAGRNGTHGRPYTDRPTAVMAAAVQHYLLGRSFDDIGRRNGLLLTTDRIHMNSQGATMIADLAAGFLQRG